MPEKNSSSTANREIVSTRVFNASRELVFNAWSDPNQIKNWWGPKGFTNTFHEFDFRAGGKWSFIMHGPAGNNFKNESLFVEIIKPEKIVIDHLSKPQFRLTATFTPVGDKTKLTFVQLFESEAMRDIIKIYAAPGNEENFDKLEALLAKLD